MADLDSTGAPTSGLFESVTHSRQSRIHFPLDDTNPSQPASTSAVAHKSPSFLSTLPSRHNSPLRPNRNAFTVNDRRRVRSVDTSDMPSTSGTLRPRRTPVYSFATSSRRQHADDGILEHRSISGTFSNEYDLSREDPKILQDVQRALMLKARREARVQANIAAKPETITPNMSSLNSSNKPTYPISSASSNKASLSSEVDFSPLSGTSTAHPVPASLDNGMTLDWSGFASSEKSERRWRLSTTKRRETEQLPHINLVVDQQDKAYSDKISRIKAVASPQTLRKADITSQQLGRRYNLIYGMLNVGYSPLNIARVARWYGSQDAVVRSYLEKAEPFTWLKHLEKRNTRPPERSPRHLSALIMEEYMHAQLRHDHMTPIPENSPLQNSTPGISISPSLVNAQLFSKPSQSSSNHLIDPSSTRRRSSEGGISFEPSIESTGNFLEVESLRSGESSRSSIISGPSLSATYSTNTHLQASDFVPKIPQDEISSSAEGHPSTHSENKNQEAKLSSAELALESDIKIIVSKEPSVASPKVESEKRPSTSAMKSADDIREPTSPVSSDPSRHDTTDRVPLRRRGLTSLPPSRRLSKLSESIRKQEADEEKSHECKARLLGEARTYNHRIRQLLNRISISVREYETAQSNSMVSLGIPHRSLPRELLDAFGHDPAAVTGATRRYRGWRAVDDIYRRLSRQREVFRVFLSLETSDMPVSKSVLDDPIASLVRSLSQLEVHSREITRRATEVGETLKAVQKIHGSVKAGYNSTLSHTSVVYPELSYIVALEESYKDQYQQFWEFGMDTLTFLLDSVTPFWRTYGKPIGDDIRDFLIIPLYRNEFTGEARKYPIEKVPSRSCRHWLALALFLLTSLAITFLQSRAAISSTTHYKLSMIPYESIRWTALPFFWFGIVIQWWAVAVESVIILLQLGILMWWAGWYVKIFT